MTSGTASSRARALWAAAAVWLGLIYVSLYAVRPLADYLRQQNLLRPVVLASFLVAGALATIGAARFRFGPRELAVLLASAAAYALVYRRLQIPEERVHLLQYGVLAGLFFGALVLGRRARSSYGGRADRPGLVPAAGALLLASFAGWVDELIQGLLPNRHYDLRDVAINALAALMAVATLLLLAEVRRGGGSVAQPRAPGPE